MELDVFDLQNWKHQQSVLYSSQGSYRFYTDLYGEYQVKERKGEEFELILHTHDIFRAVELFNDLVEKEMNNAK